MFRRFRTLQLITRNTVSSLRPGFVTLDPEQIARVSDDPWILGYVCGVFTFHLEVAKRANPRLKLSDIAELSTLQTVISTLFNDHGIGHRAGRRAWDALARSEPVWQQAAESGMNGAFDLEEAVKGGSTFESASHEGLVRRLVSIAYGIDPDREVSN